MMHMENYPVVISFGYKAGRGKDTACSMILEEFGDRYDIRQYAYADALRAKAIDMMYEAWTEDRRSTDPFDTFNGNEIAAMKLLLKNLGIPFDNMAKVEPGYPGTKQRGLYQNIGMKEREADSFHWVNKLRSRIEAEMPKFALISDMRFLNEWAYPKAFKGYNIKLVRPDLDAQEALTAEQSKHVSEVELDSLPDSAFYRVIRHTSLDDLRTQVRQLMNDIIAELEPPDITDLLNNPFALVNVAMPVEASLGETWQTKC